MLNILFVLLFIILSVWSVVHYFRKKDEIPSLIAVFSAMVLYRIKLLETGEAEWVDFNYGIGFIFNLEYAYIVGDLILLGTNILLFFYLLNYKVSEQKKDNEETFIRFLESQKLYIVIGFGFFSLFSIATAGSLSKGYSYLLTLANSSFVILLFLVFYRTRTNPVQKAVFAIFMGFIAYSTFGAALRFQFLGWAIPIFIFLVKDFSPFKRGAVYLVGGFVIMIFFSIAGAMRGSENRDAAFAELYDKGLERLIVTEDINFIDGFIMLYQIYPEYLDYHYGMDHLAIFLRPVPRTIWPDKPVGGWHQKYAMKYNYEEEFGTGISTTLYGVFYGEGGRIGIIICAIGWGFFLARLAFLSSKYNNDLSSFIKGMILASLIPILRSGDMAGDFAIVGMSYWPIFLFLYRYNKFIKKEKADNEVIKTINETEAVVS